MPPRAPAMILALNCCAVIALIGFASPALATAYLSEVGVTSSLRSVSEAVPGDFNEDGKPDVAVGGLFVDSIAVHLGNGDGSFNVPTRLKAGAWAVGIAVGDVNADGHLDIVSGGGTDVSVVVHLGNGAGAFPTRTVLASLGGLTAGIGLADLNADGKLDILACDYSDPGSVVVHIGNGDGTFLAPTSYGTLAAPLSLAVGEFNGDGKLDVATCDVGGMTEARTVSVLFGVGDGSFTLGPVLPTGAACADIASADLDADGDSDLAVALDPGAVSVFLAEGDGTFSAGVNYPVGAPTNGVAIGDVSGDAKPDILAVQTSEIFSSVGALWILVNANSGSFNVEPDHYPCPEYAQTAVTVDLNSDGRLDVVTSAIGQIGLDPFSSKRGSITSFLNCVPCAPTAVSVVLDRLSVSDGHVQATWIVPGAASIFGTVQRKQDGGEWSDLAGPMHVEGPEFTHDDGSVIPGRRYGYRLSLWDQTDAWYTNEAWILVPSIEEAPARLSLRAPYPNPSRGGVAFRVGQPRSGKIQLRVFDVQGREVARVLSGTRESGWSDVAWDGAAQARSSVPSGVYFAVLEGNGEAVRRKFVLAR